MRETRTKKTQEERKWGTREKRKRRNEGGTKKNER
jgi:hypothetical protein